MPVTNACKREFAGSSPSSSDDERAPSGHSTDQPTLLEELQTAVGGLPGHTELLAQLRCAGNLLPRRVDALQDPSLQLVCELDVERVCPFKIETHALTVLDLGLCQSA